MTSLPIAPTVENEKNAVQRANWLSRHASGIALTAAIAASAIIGRQIVPGAEMVSPLVIALVLGMIVRNLFGAYAAGEDGIRFVQQRVLRFAVILLGFQITFAQIWDLGWIVMSITVAVLGLTYVFTVLAGRLIGVERGLAQLLAAGVSVCGASAIVATNSVARRSNEDVTYAVAAVTVFGTVATLLYPVIGTALGLDPHLFGIWAGASVHEVAQVTATAYTAGEEAGLVGTIVKMCRVAMLAPLVLVAGHFATRQPDAAAGRASALPVYRFVLGFLAALAVASLVPIPQPVLGSIGWVSQTLLVAALAALGLHTSIRTLRIRGLRPLLLGGLASLFIAAASLLTIELLL